MKVKKGNMIATLIFLVIGILIPIVLPAVVSNHQYILQLIITCMMFAYFSCSWNIIAGYAGQPGLGNGLYIGLGAYIVAVLFKEFDVSPYIGIWIGMIFSALISIPLGLLTFPLSGTYYSLSTIAMLNVLRLLFNDNTEVFGVYIGGSAGMRTNWLARSFWDMQYADKQSYYIIVFILLVAVLFICWRLTRSKDGFFFRAIGNSQTAAASLGVPVLKYKIRAQVLSCAMLGLGGGFYAMYLTFLMPERMFGWDMAFEIVLMCILGGRGTIFGPVFAAFILYPIKEWLVSSYGAAVPGLPLIVYGLILILCMEFMPEGLIPLVYTKWAKHKGKKAAAALASAKAEEAEGVKIDG